VRYVLDGSVRQSINQLRVNARLIDAHTGAHLWAGRFDRETGDPFAPQNEITSRIAVALDTELVGAEAARPATEAPRTLRKHLFRWPAQTRRAGGMTAPKGAVASAATDFGA
jgi:hypothetical protein